MSLINTRIQNIRAKGNLDKNELRPSRYGALNMFLSMSNDPAGILTAEMIEKAEKSIGSVLEIPVIDYDGSVTISNTRSAIIGDDENTSNLHQITFSTFSWGFTSVPAAFMNNEVSMQADFDRKFKKYLYKFGETLDSSCVAALSADKTQVFEDTLDYTVTGNSVVVPFEKREGFLSDINPMMSANDYFQDLHVCGNGGLESIIGKLQQKGVWNSENKQLEYLDKILHYTSRIGNGASEYANAFAVSGSNLGILTRFERESILNTQTADGHEWGIDTLPMLDFPVGTYFYESVGDFSGTAGAATADLTRARKEHYGFAVDVAIVTPYNSDPVSIAAPIMQFVVQSEA